MSQLSPNLALLLAQAVRAPAPGSSAPTSDWVAAHAVVYPPRAPLRPTLPIGHDYFATSVSAAHQAISSSAANAAHLQAATSFAGTPPPTPTSQAAMSLNPFAPVFATPTVTSPHVAAVAQAPPAQLPLGPPQGHGQVPLWYPPALPQQPQFAPGLYPAATPGWPHPYYHQSAQPIPPQFAPPPQYAQYAHPYHQLFPAPPVMPPTQQAAPPPAQPPAAQPAAPSVQASLLFSDHAAQETEVCGDLPPIPHLLVQLVLKQPDSDIKLLTSSFLEALPSPLTEEALLKKVRKISEKVVEVSKEEWRQAFGTLTAIFARSPAAGLAVPNLLAFALHMEHAAFSFSNWRAYARNFRKKYPLLNPAYAGVWLSPSSSPLFQTNVLTSLPGHVAPATSSKGKAKAKSTPSKDKPCFAWNRGSCEHQDSAKKCGWGHFCEWSQCKSPDHQLADCPKRGARGSTKRAADDSSKRDDGRGSGDSDKRDGKRRMRCEYISPSFPLPLPRDVCSYDLPEIRRRSSFLRDSSLRERVLFGLNNGFCLRFNGSPLKPAHENGRSARANPDIVDSMIEEEVRLGSTAGPFPRPPFEDLQISRFSVMEKPGGNSFRFLFDLSYPDGFSVNDGIAPEDATVSYCKVTDICKKILDIGSGALLCKFDLSRAYRHVPVCPADRKLLGFKWKDQFYVDLTLPFGGRSCCAIFNEVGDLFEEIFNHYASSLDFNHYLDDFLGVGDPADRLSVLSDFSQTLSLCETMSIPLADKTVHPTSKLTFLGFVLDSTELTISLPEEKKLAYMTEIQNILGRRSLTKKVLQSLIGKLMHAAVCIPIGRAFFRSLINKCSCLPHPQCWVSLSKDERLNLAWWLNLLQSWNGISLMRYCKWEQIIDFELTSDAALTDGYGIVFGKQWVAGKWPSSAPSNIAILEMIPLVLAAQLYSHAWAGKCVLFLTDNQAVKFSAESLLPTDKHLAALVRELAIISVQNDFRFRVVHLPGKDNVLADLLSRSRFDEFFAKHPEANSQPTKRNLNAEVTRLIDLGR